MYHGRILLPSEYPFKPPNIIFLTKTGRYVWISKKYLRKFITTLSFFVNSFIYSSFCFFHPYYFPSLLIFIFPLLFLTVLFSFLLDRFEVGTKICLSISAYHEESWQPAWGGKKTHTKTLKFSWQNLYTKIWMYSHILHFLLLYSLFPSTYYVRSHYFFSSLWGSWLYRVSGILKSWKTKTGQRGLCWSVFCVSERVGVFVLCVCLCGSVCGSTWTLPWPWPRPRPCSWPSHSQLWDLICHLLVHYLFLIFSR